MKTLKMKTLKELGLAVPEILLPKKIDTEKWAVIACDQYTQNKEYWENVKKICGTEPSALNLILPEIYLGEKDKTQRIEKIRSTMNEYLKNGVFAEPKKEFIYIERTTAYGRKRCGLLAAIDLDSYEWKPFSKALVRATEATIVERLPPRMEIRKGAPLELPHIMLLVNDAHCSLVEQTGEAVKKSGKKPEYSGTLMQNGGEITGWGIESDQEIAEIEKKLNEIAEQNTESDGSVFLFAVGDGNHSLATAKAVWEEHKKALIAEGKSEQEIQSSPVRYAMAEIVNLYDAGLTFEPIHRVLFNCNPKKIIDFLAEKFEGSIAEYEDEIQLAAAVKDSSKGANFGFCFTESGKTRFCAILTQIKELAVARLQPKLDDFINAENSAGKGSSIEIDYIHGEKDLLELGKKENSLAILLPPISKDSFFATINGSGPLPRKSFSMGEADEKRFYMESRRLF